MCSRKLRQDTTFIAALVKPSWTSRVGQALMQSLRGQLPEESGPTKVVKIIGAAIPKQRGAFIPTERWLAKTFTAVLDNPTANPKVQRRCRGWSCEDMVSLRQLFAEIGIPARGKEPHEALTAMLTKVFAFVLHEEAPVHLRDELQRIEHTMHTTAERPRFVFIVGDQTGLTREQVEYLVEEFGVTPVTVGTTPMLTSHCIVVLHHLLDEIWTAELAVAGEVDVDKKECD